MTLFGRDAANVLSAMGKSLAIIEFDPSGKILSANGNFCAAMGYGESEIVGRHHRIFVEPAQANTAEYRAFWRRLADGEFVAGEFKRIGKDGDEIWLQASYNAVRNRAGKVYKVVKFASDITAGKLEAVATTGKLDAINRAQAIIEFDVDGRNLSANDNFLGAMGYTLGEIAGRHHSMFVDTAHARSTDYAEFWAKLRGGEFVTGEFRRIGKGGQDVWIQASYNPIFDMNGSVVQGNRVKKVMTSG
ncbi:PAS domain-containing protein [Aurantimonas sp. A2-1-M11]|uniref:PAS domain-containing protein n=1 Tax=Aurantimonas sp. A2-1-M11 TaxID=3113712 RepID=UPI002F954CB3